MDLAPFRSILEKRCGLVFENEKTALLEAGIHTRMKARGESSPTRYHALVCAEREEFGCFVDLLTINETYFYRDPIHFALLAGRLVPELMATRGPSAKIRILSAGCSTGEEAYSIMIALAERFGRDVFDEISVIGIDIDSTAIATAREGVFGKRSFRDFPENLLKKYFKHCPDGSYRIHRWFVDSAEFYPQNLLDADYPPVLREFDVILYRNVSIYFSQQVRNEIFNRLAEILVPGGHLFVSPSETFFYNRGTLALTTRDGTFLYCNIPLGVQPEGHVNSRVPRYSLAMKSACRTIPVPGRARSRDLTAIPVTAARPASEGGRRIPQDAGTPSSVDEAPRAAVADVRRRAEAGYYEDALRELEMLIADFPLSLAAHTEKGSILLNLSRPDEACASYCTALEIDRFCLDAVFSLGVIARLRQNEEDALRRFREAVYVRPSCWPAHFFLAETHWARGETEHARREYEVILKILEKGDFPNHGLDSLPLVFSAQQLETLCQRKLHLTKGERHGA